MFVTPCAAFRLQAFFILSADTLQGVSSRAFYGASTLICTPHRCRKKAVPGLDAQAGEARLREVVLGAGFTHFRRATQTPFNLILEAKP